MKSAVNSFYFAGPITPGDGRPLLEPTIVPAIIRDLTNNQCCLVIGPPGSGTSTTLRVVEKCLSEMSHPPHWWLFDLAKLPTGSIQEVFQAVAAEGAKRYPDNEAAWKEIADLKDGKESIDKMFYRALIDSALKLKQHIVLAVDHIEEAPRDIAKTVIRSVRSLYTQWDRTNLPPRVITTILAGSHRLRRQGMEYGSPLNFAKKHFMPELTAEESFELLSQVKNGTDAIFTPEAAEYLADMTDGDRYLLQRLGQSCWDAAHAQSPVAPIDRNMAVKVTNEFIMVGYQRDPKLSKLIPELIKDEDALYIVRWFLENPDRGLDEYWLQRDENTAGIMRLLEVREHRIEVRNKIYQRILKQNEPVISAAYHLHEINNAKLERAHKFQRLISQADLASESHEAMDGLLAEIAAFLEIEQGVTLMRYDAVAGSYISEATYPAVKNFQSEVADKDGELRKTLQNKQKTACLSVGDFCKSCIHYLGQNCSWLSLDLNDGKVHLGALILRGDTWTLSFPKERELETLLVALASTLQARQRRRGLRLLSEVKFEQKTDDIIREELCQAIASLFNRPTVYLWDDEQRYPTVRLKASPIIQVAGDLSLDVETILNLLDENETPFIQLYSFSDDNISHEEIGKLMRRLSLDSFVLSAFSFGNNRLGIIGIGSTEPWHPSKTEEALIKLVAERVQTTLDNLYHINQANRRLVYTKRAAYLLSHELKSDPARIVREIEILMKGSRSQTIHEKSEELERISAWAWEHQATVDRMLMFTWLDSNSWQQSMSYQSLISLIQGLLEQLDEEIKNKGNRCHFEHDNNQIIHEIDSYSINLIFRNLIQNALQYAPGSPIYINLWSESGSTFISIADQGPGVDPEYQSSLFEPFFRGPFNDTRTGKQGNLGLGLYLVQGLMRLHHGRVTYDAEYKAGARFLLEFPPFEGDNTGSINHDE